MYSIRITNDSRARRRAFSARLADKGFLVLKELRIKLIVLALLLLVTSTAHTQSPEGRKNLSIPRTDSAPVLDGRLDDETWKSAVRIDDMHQFLPIDHGEPSERSEFYLMYDDDYLYVGARLYDSDPDGIIARQLIQNAPMPFDDAFEFLLDPFNNMRSGYHFQINPNGVRLDGIFDNTTNINRDWDGIWDVEAVIDSQGWTSEVAIPFKTLNFNTENPDWGFSIARTIARKKEELAWSSYDRQFNPGTAGVLHGFEGLQQGMGLDIVPSLTVGRAENFIMNDADLVLEPALDISYKFTPSLTGALTFNTDFSATEVDDRQVNLSRFSLFFPEKRDFFLQDADIFSFGGLNENGIPFFSRRIGLGRSGQPVDLNAGAKLTGRLGRWNVGALTVHQDGDGGVDESLLMVGRVSANILEESSIGALMTFGDPLSNRDNALAGADFSYRNTHFMGHRSLTGNLWYQQSWTEAVTADEQAWGAQVGIGASEGLAGNLTWQRFGERFNPALGFANRTGVTRTNLTLAHRYRPDHEWLRSIFTFMELDHVENLDGKVESQQIFFRPAQLENHRGDRLSVSIFHGREVLFSNFEISPGVIIPPGDYSFFRYGSEFAMAQERVFAPRVQLFLGEYYNGERFNARGGFDWRPNKYFYAGINYDYNNIQLPAGNFQTRLIQISANVAYNAKWSWITRMQYDNFSDSVGLNSRIRWNPRAGEDLYLVLNHNFNAEGAFRGLESTYNEILLKYTRTFRF